MSWSDAQAALAEARFASFGEEATYTPAGGETIPCRAILKLNYQIAPGDWDTQLGMTVTAIKLLLAEVPDPRPGDGLTLGETAYTVEGVLERTRLEITVVVRSTTPD